MYSTSITVAALVYLHHFLLISASTQEPCSNFTFDHPPSQLPNVRVMVNGLVDGEYIPGNTYTIRMRSQSNSIFREFLIQAKSTISNSSVGTFQSSNSSVGTFQSRQSRKQKYKLACDQNTGATNTNRKKKRVVRFRWNAPPTGTGPIQFWYSFTKVQSYFWSAIKSAVIHEFRNCTVKGQIKMECAKDPRCQHNCVNKNNFIQCLLPCIPNGCQCPEGQVVNELTNECVESTMCPPKCPIRGQVRQRCSIPENCTKTCDNRNITIPCPMDCNVTGCYCPEGTVVDYLTNRCVHPERCPPKCPISGQTRKRCAIPESCTRRCDNIKRLIACPRICNVNGCECPNGMVVNNITKQCVEPTTCPLADECPPVCSYEYCNRKKKNTECSIPNDSGHNTTCLDDCNRAFCMATYYSTEVRTPSASCTPCDNPTDLSCLKNWSKCVRRQDRATYGSPVQNPENFKYYVHPCTQSNTTQSNT